MAKEGKYQLIIMDEANIAIDLDLISVEEMKEFLLNKPKELEIVLTILKVQLLKLLLKMGLL